MKKSFAIIALAALVMLAGCKKNDPKPNGTRLFAGIEQHKSDSKTSLDGLQIKWSESDNLYVNNGNTSACFTLVSGAGTTKGEFATEDVYTFAAENNLAVYPYNDNITVNNTTVTMTLPAVQEATAGTFGNGANPMMGTFSDMDNLTLTSLCGVLCLQLTGNAAITAIEIVGGPDDKLNGTFTVDYTSATPALAKSGDDGNNTVRLNCPATLTSTAQKFYVVVPAGTLHGFTMKVYDDNNNEIFSKSTANEVPVFVNTLSTMEPVEVNPYAVPLTLEALSDGTIVVYDPESGMQYTLNGGAKQTMSGSVSIDVNTGDKVAFYGNGTSIASYLDTKITGGTADVKVYGNIMSLVDEENFATATTLPETNYTFYKLFNNYDHLTDASGLLLPATTLASANYCYAEMFSNCDNLVAGPSELPATTLSPRCYQAMFSYCPSLTVAPILPATTLEGYCYYQMFKVCTSLTEAPVLPAPELTGNCYREMFSGCSSLNSITCLATSVINSSNSTFNWVNGVASSGTFTKASGANVSTDAGGSGSTWPRSNKGIPSNWDVVNDGPAPDYVFSVSSTTTVHFSSGNLYYDGSSWGFESTPQDRQYNNGGYINVFRWGANGNTAAPNHGVDIYTESGYCDIESGVLGDYGADWGQVVGELDGATGWRTLTSDEWRYIKMNGHYGLATVNGYKGLILLPDDSEVTINEDHDSYSNNQITELEWNSNYKPLGVVFLPAAGSTGPLNDDPGTGVYWSSSRSYYSGGLNAGNRCFSFIFRDEHGPNYNVSLLVSENGNHGQSVRLVR